MSEVILVGLASNIDGEERALAHLEVQHNNNVYKWQVFVPSNVVDLNTFIQDSKQSILNSIDTKEQLWANLSPKTRTAYDSITGEPIQVEIQKDEVVKPDIPDYYALRRKEYPSLGDQLDAIWKGADSSAFASMIAKIAEVKAKYPKP